MKKFKRALPVAMAIVLGSTTAPLVVRADSSKVVTLGANLTDSQKNSMYEYISELHLTKQKSSKLPMQTKENIWKESLPTNKSVPVPTAVLM
ncbi:MAG: hypothetical protein ACLU80_07320 [Dorea sp.]